MKHFIVDLLLSLARGFGWTPHIGIEPPEPIVLDPLNLVLLRLGSLEGKVSFITGLMSLTAMCALGAFLNTLLRIVAI